MIAKRTLLVGVGGQGVLTAAQILGAAAHACGCNAVVGQLHGMSQRGGSIECTVKVGDDESTVIGPGEADIVLAFEPLEALRALPKTRPDTRMLVSLAPIVPFELVRTGASYPTIDAMVAALRDQVREVVTLDGAKIVGRTGAGRTLNSVMLGAAAGLGWTAPDEQALCDEILARTAPQFRAANRRAFELGRDAVKDRTVEARI